MMPDVLFEGDVAELVRVLNRLTPSCTTFTVEGDGVRFTHEVTPDCSMEASTHVYDVDAAIVMLATLLMERLGDAQQERRARRAGQAMEA